MAKGFGDLMLELGAKYDNLVAVCPEAAFGGSREFAQRYPGRLIQVGIAEQNAVGIAAGLTLRGKMAFVCGAAPFVTMRCYEQIRDDVVYNHCNVKIVAPGCGGIVLAAYGTTHHLIEDLAIMRVLPGMIVVLPADMVELEGALYAVAEKPGPAYICCDGRLPPSLGDPPFELGKARLLRQGKDVALVAAGLAVQQALLAADLLAERGVSCAVVSLHTIKPIDEDAILGLARDCGRIFTVEERNVFAGLGGAVCEVVAGQGLAVKVTRLGLQDTFAEEIGSYQELQEHYGLSAGKIADSVLTGL